MKKGSRCLWLSLMVLTLVTVTSACAQEDEHIEKVRRVLSATPLFDGHNDLAWAIREQEGEPHNVRAYGLEGTTRGQTDIARLRAGMVGAQFWSVYVDMESVEVGAARVQLEQIDIARQFIREYPEVFEEALTKGLPVRAVDEDKEHFALFSGARAALGEGEGVGRGGVRERAGEE